jgi:hypothetical protein
MSRSAGAICAKATVLCAACYSRRTRGRRKHGARKLARFVGEKADGRPVFSRMLRGSYQPSLLS